MSKVDDLIPELQGRFPILVELNSLTREDFIKILPNVCNMRQSERSVEKNNS